MKFFSLVTLFAHYFLTIDGETSVTISYRQNSRNRRSVLFTKEVTADKDTVVPVPLIQMPTSNLQAPYSNMYSDEDDLTAAANHKNSNSVFLSADIGRSENESAETKVTDTKRTLKDKKGFESEKMENEGLKGKNGVLWEDHKKSSVRTHEATDLLLNSNNLTDTSKTVSNNSEKTFVSTPVSAEYENSLHYDPFKRRLERTQKGNLISSILAGKSSLELMRGQNRESKNRTATNGPIKLEKSRLFGEENAVEECQHAITSTKEKWSQFCKLLFLLQAENVNKFRAKTSSRGANENPNIKGQNMTGAKEPPGSNLPLPKSQYKSPKTPVNLSSFPPYQIARDSDSFNLQTQKSSFQVKNDEREEDEIKKENDLLPEIKKSSFRKKFMVQIDPTGNPHLPIQVRKDSLTQEKVVPQNSANNRVMQIDKERSIISDRDSNPNYQIKNSSKEDYRLRFNISSAHKMRVDHSQENRTKNWMIEEKSSSKSFTENVQKGNVLSDSQSEIHINQWGTLGGGLTKISDYAPNDTNVDKIAKNVSTVKWSNIIYNYSPNTIMDKFDNATTDEQKTLQKENTDISNNDSKNIQQVYHYRNSFLTKSVTTLPSVFKENLIPPLPQKWPENGAEELWTDLDRQEGVSFNEDEFYSNKEDEVGNGTQQFASFRKDNSSILSQNLKETFNKISFVDTDTSQNYTQEKYRPPDTDYDEYVLEAPSSNYQNESRHLKESIPTVRIAGKADISDTPISTAKERVSFITIPPGTHWHLWGGFPGRRRVDPIFEMSNGTGDVSQVYTAYWGNHSDSSTFITGIWILRIGAGVGLLTLVLTVAAQTVRFCQPLLSQKAVLTTNLSTSLAAAHVVFIFGIQATEGLWICGVVALFLHFLYLLTCNWILALSIRLLRSLLQKKPFHTAAYCVPVWIASLSVIVVSYGLNPSGYETRRFCWLSIERGMLFAFIGPVCTLLLVNAGVCIACQKILLDASIQRDSNDKSDLRVGVTLLPLHGVAWFLTVVALEDDLSLALDCAAALATAAVGFLTLHFYVPAWQQFLHRHLPCPLPSTSGTKSLIPIPMATTLESSNLSYLEAQLPQPSATSCSLSSSSSTTALLEEHQLDSIYSSGYRREAY